MAGANASLGFRPPGASANPAPGAFRRRAGAAMHTPERRIFQTRRGQGHAGSEPEVRLHKDGHPITLSVVTGAIRDASGSVSELAAIMRDITAAQHRDAQLQRLVAEQAARERLMRDLTA